MSSLCCTTDIVGKLPVENQALRFAQELVYGEEKMQMCTESSGLQFRDILFAVEKVFFFFLCTCMFPVLAALSITAILEGISHLQGW